jgi:YHS domain-containing protein
MRFTISLLAAALTLAVPLSMGNACCGPRKPKFCCPVVGFTEAKDKCCCPSGYCPREPTAQIVAEYKGQKVQFCCSKCVPLFKKDPAKFAANANHQLAARGLAKQVSCPLCGGKVSAAHAVDVASVRVLLCSEKCKASAEKGSLRQRIDRVFAEKPFATAFSVTGAKR